ncbi:unnamed protein product [Closterium sp. NIES-65]|nr:unnamed protein product [Closterium sp. NIES-65]
MPTRRKSHAILLLRSAFLLQLTFSLVAFAASPATFPPQPSRHRATVSVARPDGRDGETEEGGESGEGGEGWDGETDWDEDPWRNQRVSPSPMLHDHATSVRRALAAGDPGDSQSSADGMSAALGAAGRGGLGRHRSREVRRLEQPITRSQLALLSLNFFPEVSGVDVITDDEGGDEGGKKRREQVALPNLECEGAICPEFSECGQGIQACWNLEFVDGLMNKNGGRIKVPGRNDSAANHDGPTPIKPRLNATGANASVSAGDTSAASAISSPSDPQAAALSLASNASSSAAAILAPSTASATSSSPSISKDEFLAHAASSATAVATPSASETPMRRRLVEEQGRGEGFLRHLQDSSTAAVATPSVPETSTRRRLAGEKSTGEGLQGSGGLSGAVRLKCPPINSQQITPGMVLLPNCSLAIASPEDGLKAWEGRNGEGKQGPGEEGEEEGDGAEEEEVEEVGGEGEGKGVRYGGGRGWAGRVVELRGVWVDGQGRVFNASHLFWPGGGSIPRAGSQDLSAFSIPIPSAFSIPILPLPSQWLHVMAPHYLGAPPHQVTLFSFHISLHISLTPLLPSLPTPPVAARHGTTLPGSPTASSHSAAPTRQANPPAIRAKAHSALHPSLPCAPLLSPSPPPFPTLPFPPPFSPNHTLHTALFPTQHPPLPRTPLLPSNHPLPTLSLSQILPVPSPTSPASSTATAPPPRSSPLFETCPLSRFPLFRPPIPLPLPPPIPTPPQPCFQHCNRPSPALLSSLRSHHLLPPEGLPLFHANWTLRRPPPVPLPPPGGTVSTDVEADVSADMANGPGGATVDADGDGFAGVRGMVGEDWVVVVAVPPGAMLLDKMEEMVDGVIQDNWWNGRVVYFRGTMGVQEARALFSHALLLIAPPGEALDFILFMPPAAVVLEIQPSSHPSSSHRALSHSLSLRHHTLFCKLLNVSGQPKKLSCDRLVLAQVMQALSTEVFFSLALPRGSRAARAALGKASIPDAYAMKPGASEAGWTVREGVKYEWVVGPSTCPSPHVPEEIKAFELTAKARLKDAQEKERVLRSQLEKNGTGDAAAAEKTAAAAAAAVEAAKAATAAAAAAAVNLSNPWLPFNASVFCERVGRGRRILFLGDSKQYQMVQVFVNHMAWGWKGKRKPAKELVNLEERPKACVDALGGNAAKMGHEFCQW